jgi:uncharacterized protein with PIN domain
VTYLDAYAVVALMTRAPAAGEVEALLRTRNCAVVVANLAESIDVAHRVHGYAFPDARRSLDPLLVDVVEAVQSSQAHAWLAAELRSLHYERRSSALSLADCFLLAHALADGDAIVTADPPVAAAARAEGVDVVGLPDSRGRRP